MGSYGRFCLAAFRVVQVILSVVALAFGIYITYTMYQMAASGKELMDAIKSIKPGDNDADGMKLLQKFPVPVLKHLTGAPTRAIIVSVVALWSTLFIDYLALLNRAGRNSYRDLMCNSRTTRALLSVLSVLLWVVAIVSSALLVIQYGIFAVSLGPICKTAVTTPNMLSGKRSMKQQPKPAGAAARTSDTISNILDIVGRVMTIGAMAIVLLVASLICGVVEPPTESPVMEKKPFVTLSTATLV